MIELGDFASGPWRWHGYCSVTRTAFTPMIDDEESR